ncbi:MAG: hypothetical protein RL238_1872 [Actinomycetota bacterium]
MVTRTRWAVLVAAALVLSACQPNRFVSGWIPSWQASSGRATVQNTDVASLYIEVSLMWYGTAADGTLPLAASKSSLDTTIGVVRAAGLPVLPTIFDSSPKGTMRAILKDPARRAAHVSQIVNLVVSNNYDGIDLDYEVFAFSDGRTAWSEIAPNWVLFIQSLSYELHRRGKLLMVTVPPVWTDSLGRIQGYTVYEQAKIAPYVDRLRLMVYDWSISSPGPISPNYWQASVIAYSSKVVPPKKLQLGLPAYGRHWTDKKVSSETCPDGTTVKTVDSITMRETAALVTASKATPTRHSSGEVTLVWDVKVTGPTKLAPTYVPVTPTVPTLNGSATASANAERIGVPRIVTCTIRHTVYVPDGATVKAGADRALAAGWSGIILWAMGYETSDVYSALGTVAQQRAIGTPTGTLDTPAPSTGTVRLTGVAYHPEWDLPVAVRITVTPQGGAVREARTVVANANRAEPAAGLGPFHGIDTTFTLPTGTYDLCATIVNWGAVLGPSIGCRSVTVTTP